MCVSMAVANVQVIALTGPLKKYFAVSLKLWNDITRNSFKFPEEKCGISLVTFHEKLKQVHKQSATYAEAVTDLCWFGHDEERVKRIKEKVLSDDFGELDDFLSHLKTFRDTSEKSYESLNKELKDIISTAQKVAQACRKEAEKESRKKKTTRAVGGSAAAGALAAGAATGVALSVVAGVFTFGVGTIVGLALTAAGTAVGGATIAAGTGIATHAIASHFAESEKRLMELSQSFDEVMSCASSMDHAVRSLNVQLESISTNLSNVSTTKTSHEVRSSLIVALDRLWQKFDGFDYEQFSELIEELKKKGSDLPKPSN